jgi:DNA-directed RNA polymerase subunit omega
MMVEPTVTDLLKKVEDRYELVAITSKRARQIALGDTVLTNSEEKSPVTLAAIEIAEGKVVQVGEESEIVETEVEETEEN